MRVLVTGGAGFLGSHLCERLLGMGHEVVCLDNYSTGSRFNIAHLKGPFKLKFADVGESIGIDRDISERDIDQIYNLACPASPKHYQQHPIHTIRTCVLGAINVLEFAQQQGARVLQASTSEIYGDPLVHPQPESYVGAVNPIGPRSCYDEGKRCAESLFINYRRQRGVDARIVRIFNTYGPRMAVDDGRVVSNFIVSALQGEPLTIYGDGSQTRSLCYVDELIDGLIAVMNTPEWEEGPMNLGNPEEHSIADLATLIWSAVGVKITATQFKPLPTDDPKRRQPDIEYAKRALGWSPKVPLIDGIKSTIDYFRDLLLSVQST